MKDAAKGGIGFLFIVVFAVVLAWPTWLLQFLPKPSETVVVIAQVLSAGGTAAAAIWAARSADASRRSAQIGADTVNEVRRERRDQILPVVIITDVRIVVETDSEQIVLASISVRNLGRGPAIGCGCSVTVGGVAFSANKLFREIGNLGNLDISEPHGLRMFPMDTQQSKAAYAGAPRFDAVTEVTYRSAYGRSLKSEVKSRWNKERGMFIAEHCHLFEKSDGEWVQIQEEDKSEIVKSGKEA